MAEKGPPSQPYTEHSEPSCDSTSSIMNRETELYPVKASNVCEKPSHTPAVRPMVCTPGSMLLPGVVPRQIPDILTGRWRSKGTEMRAPVRSCLMAASMGPGLPHSTPSMVTNQRMQHLVQFSTARFPFHVTLRLELECIFW